MFRREMGSKRGRLDMYGQKFVSNRPYNYSTVIKELSNSFKDKLN